MPTSLRTGSLAKVTVLEVNRNGRGTWWPGGPQHAQAWQLAESCPEAAEGMSEIEFSVLAGACLKRRNPDEEALQRNIGACEAERGGAGTTINWRRFTT